MTQQDKLIAKILAHPTRMRYSEVGRLLRMYGWVFDRKSGSHVSWVKENEGTITFPVTVGDRYVKGVYLVQISKRLGLQAE